jgi:hypothetical protein
LGWPPAPVVCPRPRCCWCFPWPLLSSSGNVKIKREGNWVINLVGEQDFGWVLTSGDDHFEGGGWWWMRRRCRWMMMAQPRSSCTLIDLIFSENKMGSEIWIIIDLEYSRHSTHTHHKSHSNFQYDIRVDILILKSYLFEIKKAEKNSTQTASECTCMHMHAAA